MSVHTTSAFDTNHFASLSLSELNASAELLTRVDRKYIVAFAQARALLEDIAGDAGVSVLEREQRRTFRYESMYLDTADFALHRAAAHRRRRRFKVRIRRYVDDQQAMLEVKTKDGRGHTVKHRLDRPWDATFRLDEPETAFVASCVGNDLHEDGLLPIVNRLIPALQTSYLRTSLVDLRGQSRITIDEALVCTEPAPSSDGRPRAVGLDDVVLETKSDGRASRFDRWLWARGIRPIPMSKYCTALAMLHPDLPRNKWHQTIKTHFEDTVAAEPR